MFSSPAAADALTVMRVIKIIHWNIIWTVAMIRKVNKTREMRLCHRSLAVIISFMVFFLLFIILLDLSSTVYKYYAKRTQVPTAFSMHNTSIHQN